VKITLFQELAQLIFKKKYDTFINSNKYFLFKKVNFLKWGKELELAVLIKKKETPTLVKTQI
jgi:hypothetical protein